jgi:hypothetical protein
MELFTQKNVIKLSKIWVWDSGSGKNIFRIQNPGVKKAPDPGSGSATLFSYRMKLFQTMPAVKQPGDLELLYHFKYQLFLLC